MDLILAFCDRSLHGERGVYHGFMVFYLTSFRFYFLVLLSKLVHSFALVSSSASAFACMVRRRLLSTIIIDLIAWAAFFFWVKCGCIDKTFIGFQFFYSPLGCLLSNEILPG